MEPIKIHNKKKKDGNLSSILGKKDNCFLFIHEWIGLKCVSTGNVLFLKMTNCHHRR